MFTAKEAVRITFRSRLKVFKNRIIKIDKPDNRVYYKLQEIGIPDFEMVLDDPFKKHLK